MCSQEKDKCLRLVINQLVLRAGSAHWEYRGVIYQLTLASALSEHATTPKSRQQLISRIAPVQLLESLPVHVSSPDRNIRYANQGFQSGSGQQYLPLVYTARAVCSREASVMGASPHPYQHHAPHCINFLSFPFNTWVNKKL